VITLHPFVPPVRSMSVHEWQGFGAEIVRGEQRCSTLDTSLAWRGAEQPEAEKIEWKQASVALQPLVEWSHVEEPTNR
jgi:hypothetical protein